MRKFFLYIIISFLPSVSIAQYFYDFNTNCKKAYSEIISLKFDEGREILEKEKIINPKNNIPYYLENYIDFLKLFLSEDKNDFEKLKQNKYSRINRLEKGDKNSPYYKFCLAEVSLQWAFLKVKYKNYISAGIEINHSYNLLNQNKKKFSDFILNNKSLGLLHVVFGSIPDNYKWLTDFIGFKGTIDKGVSELESILYAENQKIFEPECLFYLSLINLNIKSNKKETLKFYNLFSSPEYDKYLKTNLLLIYSKTIIALHTGKNEEALKTLLARPTDKKYFNFYYLDYLTGIAKLNKLDISAEKYFLKYIKNYKGNNYKQAAYEKIAWCYLIKGDIKNFYKNIDNIKSIENTDIGADKQAVYETKNRAVPNIYLLKARLLFDGGYYKKAINILNNDAVLKTFNDTLEYTYRTGRIYDESGEKDKAIFFYETTIKKGFESKKYFAANSALKLGIIYENQSNISLAKKYYNKCLMCKNTEYRNSIRQKAKARLQLIENK